MYIDQYSIGVFCAFCIGFYCLYQWDKNRESH